MKVLCLIFIAVLALGIYAAAQAIDAALLLKYDDRYTAWRKRIPILPYIGSVAIWGLYFWVRSYLSTQISLSQLKI